MRLSCNGCRVLRKGCSESCSIRPCLQWIKTPDAQSNATVFLAKFYGRAGLLNLVNAAQEHLRPAVFRSLLYEACGRIVNPIYGSVGLLWSGNWNMCQAAVEAVLKGAPIVQISSDQAATAANSSSSSPPVAQLDKAAYDIRHVADSSSSSPSSKKKQQQQQQHSSSCPSPPTSTSTDTKEAPADSDNKPGHSCLMKKRTSPSSPAAPAAAAAAATCNNSNKKPKQQQASSQSQHQQDSAVSDHRRRNKAEAEAVESMDSDEAAASHVSQAEHSTHNVSEAEHSTHDVSQAEQPMGLDLTLGFAPVPSLSLCVPRPAAVDAGCSVTGTGWTAGEPAFRFL